MLRLRLCLAVILLLGAFVTNLHAQQRDSLDPVAATLDWDEASNLSIDGDLAAVATKTSGLRLLDISVPESPVELGVFDTPAPDQCLDVILVDQYAFIATNGSDNYLRIIDVSDPAVPVEVQLLEIPDFIRDIDYEDGYVYVVTGADDDVGMVTIDATTDPADAEIINVTSIPANQPNFISIDLQAEHAYVAITENLASNHSLLIFDVSNRQTPVELGSLALPDYPGRNLKDVDVAGDYAFLAGGLGGVSIVDVSDPTQPVEAFHYTAPDQYVSAMEVIDGYAYLANGSTPFLSILDVSNPTSPAEVGSVGNWGSSLQIAVQDGIAYVTDIALGMQIIDVSTPVTPAVIRILCADMGETKSLTVANGTVWASTYGSGVIGFEPGGIGASRLLSIIKPTYQCFESGVSGNLLYVSARENAGVNDVKGIFTFDISDPSNPVELSFFQPVDFPTVLSVAGEYLYTMASHQFTIYDASQPGVLTPLGTVDDIADGHITIEGDHAFVATGGGYDHAFTIIDISDPTAPYVQHTEILDIETRKLIVAGDYLYVGAAWDGLYVYDISDLDNPTQINFTDICLPLDMELQGDFLFTANDYYQTGRTIKVLYVGNPAEITEAAVLDVPDWYPKFIELDANMVYSTMHQGQLRSFEFSSERFLDLTLLPDSPVAVAPGGTFAFDLMLVSDLPQEYPIDVWTEAILPNGNVLSPITVYSNRMLQPGTTYQIADISQQIPLSAPEGAYTFIMNSGVYPNLIESADFFSVDVVGESVATGTNQEWQTGDLSFADVNIASNTDAAQHPSRFAISSVNPNPFNASTTLSVALPDPASLHVTIYNVTGQRVAELAQGSYAAGTHRFTFDASGLASGLYFVRATVPGQMDQVQKVMLVR